MPSSLYRNTCVGKQHTHNSTILGKSSPISGLLHAPHASKPLGQLHFLVQNPSTPCNGMVPGGQEPGPTVPEYEIVFSVPDVRRISTQKASRCLL